MLVLIKNSLAETGKGRYSGRLGFKNELSQSLQIKKPFCNEMEWLLDNVNM